MDWRSHIHSDPEILLGKPVVKGTRLSIEGVRVFEIFIYQINVLLFDEYRAKKPERNMLSEVSAGL
ncbi:MAG: DUF433 domain-containing protein [Anaerolineae bacterium]